ncbi:MAG: hypothetical protein EXS18_01960 [Verrucomicrobiae bacterium]|nr:hypothetical protein [Verrucomicrobiae bacterium]
MARRGSFSCPACGEQVPAGARSCPECGSDEKTGWSEGTVYDATDISDEKSFDYDRFLEKEGLTKPSRSRGQRIWLVVTAVVILALVLLLALSR